jgi:thioesterase domain-containing protein
VRLFAEIEKAFEKRPPLASLFQEPTIEYLAVLINDNTAETKAPPSSLIAVQPQGTKRPIFCVHTFFGDVLCYMNLARRLGSDQPFYAIEARGLNGIDEPFDDLTAMAAYYIEQIRVVQPEGPYALAGLCSAGIVAFEMAQQLRAKGDPVAMVALFDSQVGSPTDDKLAYKSSFRDLLADIPSWLIGSLELNRSQWLDLVKLKVRVARAKKAVSGDTAGASQSHTATLIDEWGGFFQFSERHLKIARAQSRALRKYRPQIYPGRLTLFKARMQPLFSSHRPDKGWRRLAAGGLDIRVVPGNQLAMLKEPHVRVLAEQLSDLLAE